MAWTARQTEAIEKRGTNLLVSAAAGSGKTAVLVERIKRLLLEENASIDRMLIVTFTNAASAEMKERIFGMLSEASKDRSISPERRSALRHQMNLLPNAYICTFDKFAIQLVRRYYYCIGVPPELSICEGPSQALLKNDAMAELFDGFYEAQDKDFYSFLDRYSSVSGDSEVRSLILSFHTFLQSLPDPDAFMTGTESGDNFNIEKYIEYACDYCLKEIKASIGVLKIARNVLLEANVTSCGLTVDSDISALAAIAGQLETGNSDEAFALLNELSFGRMSAKKDEKESWNSVKDYITDLRKKVKERVKKVQDMAAKANTAVLGAEKEKTGQPLNELCRLTRAFDSIYSKKKAAKSLADFSDMQHYALKILENKDVCREYREALDYIFIDEYQDSNLIQDALISHISRGNNVFMVGDVKQSIYKFRLAEPELFLGKYDLYKSGAAPDSQVIDLNSNFRSKGPVIDYINQIFEVLMTRESCGIEYDEDAQLLEGDPYVGPGLYTPKFYLIDRESEEGEVEEEIAELKNDELEALNAVRLIKEYVGRPVYDAKKKTMRPLKYSDMAVLLRALKGRGEVYYDILSRADIPVYMDRGEGYFDTLEIQVFLNLLRIIDNRSRDLPFLSVLRFPSFGFHAKDLADIRIYSKEQGKGKISFSDAFYLYAAEGPDGDLKARCSQFCAQLESWRIQAQNMPLGDFLWKLLNETGVSYFAVSVTGGAQREANLRALVDKAENYEAEGSGGLYGFINYIEMINARGGKIETGQVKTLSESADVVRIMTIHKSKGLEFPFVLLAGLNGKLIKPGSKGKASWHKQFGASIRVVNPDTGLYADPLSLTLINSKKLDEEMAESIRVLYVAMTRAKDILIMSAATGHAMKTLEAAGSLVPGDIQGYHSYFEMICSAVGRGKIDIVKAADLYASGLEEAVSSIELMAQIKTGFDVSGCNCAGEIERRLCFDYAPETFESEKRKYSVSEIAAASHEPYVPRVLATDENEEDVNEELMLRGAAKGTAYHTVMEHIPFTAEGKSPEEIRAFIEGLRTKNILTDLEARSVDPWRIKAFFDSEIGRRAIASPELHKEAPFVLQTEYRGRNVLVQGVIDCYFREGDKYILLDYKSNSLDRNCLDEELQRMKDTYIPQLALYKEAMERILGVNVAGASLWLFSADMELKL